MFGRATITLGIGPHSSCFNFLPQKCSASVPYYAFITACSLLWFPAVDSILSRYAKPRNRCVNHSAQNPTTAVFHSHDMLLTAGPTSVIVKPCYFLALQSYTFCSIVEC